MPAQAMPIVAIIIPIFALILLGWLIRRHGGLAEGFWRDLERLIYFIFFPALLFHSLAHARLDLLAAWPMVVVGVLFTLTGMGLGRLSKNLFHDPLPVYAAAFQCSFRFNSFIGLAVAEALHGKAGIAALGLLMGVLVPMANLAAVAVLARHGEGRWLRELIGNPLILATAAGLAFSLTGLEVPELASTTLELLSRASLPLGLIAVGAGLRLDALDHARGHLWYGVAVKLLILPAVALGLSLAFGLTGIWFQTAILLAALPVSTVAYVLANRMGGDGRIIAAQVAVTTLLSMITLPLWLSLSR
ncbi:AEC family transporter [uncultured Lamprocystis sp.]|uniref:AEC family transporter n=2 Tax=uncultured Lamprocystis sp. TaxID=543132 RepID=UPI0025EFF30F|nr:AEC family transporter [uncultured Lamprocystis sp.]